MANNKTVGKIWGSLGILCAAFATFCIGMTEFVRAMVMKPIFGNDFLRLLFWQNFHTFVLSVHYIYLEYAYKTGPYYHRKVPVTKHRLGCLAKLGMEVTCLWIAIILRVCPVEIYYSLAWIALAADFQVFRQLRYAYCDFSFFDLFLGALMQIFVVYQKQSSICTWVLKLTLYAAVIYCRYRSYPTPTSSRKANGRDDELAQLNQHLLAQG